MFLIVLFLVLFIVLLFSLFCLGQTQDESGPDIFYHAQISVGFLG